MCKYSIDAIVCGIVGSVPTNKSQILQAWFWEADGAPPAPRARGGRGRGGRRAPRGASVCSLHILTSQRVDSGDGSDIQDTIKTRILRIAVTTKRIHYSDNTTINYNGKGVLYSNDYHLNDSDLKLEIVQMNTMNYNSIQSCLKGTQRGLMVIQLECTDIDYFLYFVNDSNLF